MVVQKLFIYDDDGYINIFHIITAQKSTSLGAKRVNVSISKRNKTIPRSYQLHKRGAQATEDELAHHVQSVFSDLEEFGASKEEEGVGDDDETCVLSNPSASCKKLDRYSSLVLNADYQVGDCCNCLGIVQK